MKERDFIIEIRHFERRVSVIDTAIVGKIKKTSVEDRLRIIEKILQSIQEDISQKSASERKKSASFKVRKFSLGEEVHVDRDILYSDRGL